MLKQTRPKDLELFVSMAKLPPTKVEDLRCASSSLRSSSASCAPASSDGFLIYVPFYLIDMSWPC